VKCSTKATAPVRIAAYPTEQRVCELCGAAFSRRRRMNGRLERYATYIKRRFCSVDCSRRSRRGCIGLRGPNNPKWKGDEASETTKRARAHKLYPLSACQECNA